MRAVRSEPVAARVPPSRWRRLATIDRRLIVLLLCAPLLGLIGVVAADLVPNDPIADNLLDARDAGQIGPSDENMTPLGTSAARYTECTALSLGLGSRPGDNVLTNTMRSPAYTGCARLDAALDEYAETGTLRAGFPYLRYWHGYAIITRPALAVFGVTGTRWIAFVVSLVAVFGMCAAVKRSFGVVATLLLVGPALLTSDMVVSGLSASTAIGSACAWIGGWMAMLAVAVRPSWTTAALAAAVAGAISAYLDLMTTMPGALALTSVGATLGACVAGRPSLRIWRIAAAAVVGWIVGLAWMWGWKWVIAAAVLGIDTVDDSVRSQIEFRLSSGTSGVSDARFGGLTANLEMWWDRPLTPWVVVAMAAALGVLAVVALAKRRRLDGRWGLVLCALIALAPAVAWYVALNNHSQIHPLLVYRSLPIAFGGAIALLYLAVRQPNGDAAQATLTSDSPSQAASA